MNVLAAIPNYEVALPLIVGPTYASRTTTGRDANYTHSGVAMRGASTYVLCTFDEQTAFISARQRVRNEADSSGSTQGIIEFGDGTTQAYRIRNTGDRCHIEMWDGVSAWTDLDGSTGYNSFPDDTNYNVTLDVKIHATEGYVELFKNDLSVLRYDGDTTTPGVSGITECRFRPWSTYDSNSVYNSYHYEMVVADESLEGCRLMGIEPQANSDETDWTGDYTTVDRNDANLLSPTASGDKELYTGRSVPVGAPPEVKAVHLHYVAKTVGTVDGTDDIQALMKLGGTEYTGDAFVLGATDELHTSVEAVNPNTAITWTHSDIDDLKYGVEAL